MGRKGMGVVSAALAGLLSIGAVGAVSAQGDGLAGAWDGAILVMGGELPMTVHFTTDGGTLAATMDIPAQGAMGLPLRNVRQEGEQVHFELMGGPGLAVFEGQLTTDSIGGTFTQAGVNGTFHLIRAGAQQQTAPAEAPPPYRNEDVSFANGDITLAGTLTLPEGPGPFPAVVLITGSGPQNRDEEVFGMRPFRLLADHLTRQGIAVLRYDDRGVGGSTGNVQLATSSDFADDALAGVAMLKERSDIAPQHIGLIGHSEGGIVAPIAANRSSDVAFIVLLAGTAVPGSEILVAQARVIMEAGGATTEALAEQERTQRMIFAAVQADTGWDGLRAEIERQVRNSIDELPAEQRATVTDVDTFVKTRADQQLVAIRTPWFRYFLDYDPATALREVRVPVLAVFGELDLQVPPAVTLEPMRGALETAPTTDVTFEVVAGANHLFQAATTGSPNEYASLPKEFIPGFADLLSTWILERTR